MNDADVDFHEFESAIRESRPDLLDVARGVGARAASLGVPLHEVLNHVERSFSKADPPYDLVRSTVLGFSERVAREQLGDTCEDPLTGWCTTAHLRTVLSGVYRVARRDDDDVRERYAMCVVESVVRPRTGIERSLYAIDVEQALRLVFGGDEAFVRLATHRFGVLAERDSLSATQLRLLTMMLDRALPGPQPRLWVELLPSDESDLSWTLAGMTG